MLFNFKRFKKVALLVIFLMVVITVGSFWKEINGFFSGIIDTGREIIGLREQFESTEKSFQRVADKIGSKGIIVDREIEIITEDKKIKLLVEDARTSSQIARGLMYRESICKDCGMVFYFEEDRMGGFWMKNCMFPLDMLFLDKDGIILDIKENFEPCDVTICPSYAPIYEYRYVLEVNGGWTSKNNVIIGDKVEGL